MRDQRKEPMDRRSFLRTAVGTTAVTVAAVASSIPVNDARAYDPGSAEGKGRYRETDHVREYYRTNGYETLKR